MKKTNLVFILYAVLLVFGCSTTYKNLTAEIPDLTSITDGIYRVRIPVKNERQLRNT
jgi:hypothetical protein